MIQIKRLVLKNFKSFKKAEMPISRGFTAIVGSNGSGKSNILDALLFVLGISSLKALRASRMTDLVNFNSKEDYAKVEITLEDKKKEKKWLISRTVDKKGKSIVRLDDKRVALNEVTGLLEELGITATGHNIVVQGDITRIMEMNAIQRRELVDDAAGIREFDDKRKESFKELEKVDQKIKEVRIVLSERETYLEELSKERTAAMEFNRISGEIRQTKATLFRAELSEISGKIEKNISKKELLEKELDEKTVSIKEEQEQLESLEKKIEETNQQIISSSEKTYSGIGILVEEKKSEKKVREERKNSFNETIQKNNEKTSVLKNRNKEIEKELLQKSGLLAEKEKEIILLEKELALEQQKQEKNRSSWSQKNQELKELERNVRQEEEKLDRQRQIFFEKQSQVQGTKKTIELKKQSLKELLEEKSRLEEKISSGKEKKEILEELLKKEPFPEKTLKELEQKIRENHQKKAYNDSKIDSVKEAIQQLEKAIANCPTCDSKLDATVKKRVLDLKKKDLLRISRENEAFLEQKNSLAEKKESLEGLLAKKRGLEIKLGDFTELTGKNTEIEQKVRKLKQEIDSVNVSGLETELKNAEKAFHSLKETVLESEHEITAFKKQNNFEVFGEASKKIEQLSKKINEEKGIKKQLELETSLVLTEETKANDKNIISLEQENTEYSEKLEKEEQQIQSIQKGLEKLELELAKSEKATKDLSEQKQRFMEKLSALKQKIIRLESKIKENGFSLNLLAIENSKLEVRETDLKEESKEFEEVPVFESFDVKELRQKIPELERQIKKMGAINQKAVEHFGEFEKELIEVKKKSDKLEEERLAVLDMIKKIEDRRTQVFMDCFNAINKNFNDIFFTLAEGEGKLSLSDPEKPLESGLLIEARMKGKAIYSIDSMSGGEKTLSSLAFLFALQMYDPAPFYVFDEADAALDKENSMRLGKIIGKISQNSQFIGITHNDTIVREANQIIGVALNEQKSSVIGLKLKEKETAA